MYKYIVLSMDIKEAAAICDKSTDTVRRWCKKQGLKHTKKGFQGIINISEDDLKNFCDEHGIERKGGRLWE